MSTCKVCDKCKKIIPPDDDKESKSVSWSSYTTYSVVPKKKKTTLKRQKVAVGIRIYLECGDPLDLCHKCGWNIIRNYTK